MSTTLASINLNRLVVFAAVVESGSLTAAAEKLGLAKTMVSKHIQRLEIELNSNLLVRTTRRLRLTDVGEQFYNSVQLVLRNTEDAIDALGHDRTEPRGKLRVTTPIDFGATVMVPLLVALQRRHSALKIELLTADRQLDLVSEGIDVAIRFGRMADSNLQAIRLGAFAEWLVASPKLFPKKQKIVSPENLAGLPFIAMSALRNPLRWRFERAGVARTVHFTSNLTVNTAHAARSATLAGGGLAVVADFEAAPDVAAGRLIRLLPDWTLPGGGIYAVFPATRYRPVNTRVLIDALKAHIAQQS